MMVSGRNDFLDSLQRRSTVVKAMLVAFMAMTGLALIAALVLLYYEVSIPYSVSYAIAIDGDRKIAAAIALMGWGFLCAMLLGLAVAVALPVWIYRAWSNLHVLGLEGLNYTPGWAAGSLFVPFVNLVIPMKAMRELYNRSSGEDAWQSEAPAPDVSSWWSAFLAAMFLRLILLYVLIVNSIPFLRFVAPPGVNTGLHALSMILFLAAAFFLFRAVSAITRFQMSSSHVSQAFT
ncbi:MAG: DUF4328 domain-containing protein [Novosphingobium sp.]